MKTERMAELAHELKTQDDAFTKDAFFVVYHRRKIHGMDSDYTHDYEWVEQESGDYTVADERMIKVLERYERIYGDEPKRWRRVYYVTVDEFVTCTFTRKAAEEFIKRRSHDYKGGLVIDVDSFVRNPEMREIRAYLEKGPAPAVAA